MNYNFFFLTYPKSHDHASHKIDRDDDPVSDLQALLVFSIQRHVFRLPGIKPQGAKFHVAHSLTSFDNNGSD